MYCFYLCAFVLSCLLLSWAQYPLHTFHQVYLSLYVYLSLPLSCCMSCLDLSLPFARAPAASLCLGLPCLTLSYLDFPYVVSSYIVSPTLICLILSCLVLSFLFVSRLTLTCLNLFSLTLSRLTLSCLSLSCLTSTCLTLSCPVVGHTLTLQEGGRKGGLKGGEKVKKVSTGLVLICLVFIFVLSCLWSDLVLTS